MTVLRPCLLVVFAGAFGCQQLLGIETGEADPAAGGAATAASTSAAGGAAGVGGRGVTAGPTTGSGGDGAAGGGGGGGVPALDWTGAFVAVYAFEAPDLGLNTAGPPGTNLMGNNGPLRDPAQSMEGSASVHLNEYTSLSSSAAALAVSPSLTIGAWVRDEGAPNNESTVVSKTNFTDDGYRLGRSENNDRALRCRGGNTSGITTAQSSSNVWGMATWMHVACVFSDTAILGYVSGSHNGYADATAITNATADDFRIGSGDFTGHVDEVFVIDKVLTPLQVRRIYACQIDGSLCTCNGAAYVNCGRAETACLGLPACNAPPP